MKIINIPIEPIEDRYSIQWDTWFKKEFKEYGLDIQTIYGNKTSKKIRVGSFLDVIETNAYKTSQLLQIIDIISQDAEEKIILFFHDLWFPGITNIAYIRDGLGRTNLKICGCLHAGSYDPKDFLSRKGMNNWASSLEDSMLRIADQIFVATRYHKNLITDNRNVDQKKIIVTGFPIYPDFIEKMNKPIQDRQKIITFPHRLDPEKRPDLFEYLKDRFRTRDFTWIKTVDSAQTKKDYYHILQDSYISISFAEQETWGIAMQESVLCGAIPICPNRLSYTEMYNEVFLYNCLEELETLIRRYVEDPPINSLRRQQDRILQKGSQAISNIINNLLL